MSDIELAGALRRVGFAAEGPPRRGATATVVRAVRQAESDSPRPLAVKVFDSSASWERFEREAAILATIDHPSIAPLIEFGHLETGQPFLVMPWIDGVTLAERLQAEGSLEPAVVRRILVQLGDALDHLHDRGIVHRDLSLANVLVDDANRITLIDFGLARGEAAATVTATSDLVGTTRYLAPELLQGAAPSPASDQYAAAMISYELAAGVWPFDASDSVGTTFHHHLSSHPIPLRERAPSAPSSLEQAIDRALAKDPDDRFATVSELADAALGADGDGASQPSPSWQPPTSKWRLAVGAVAAISVVGLLVLIGSGDDAPNLDEPVDTTTSGVDTTEAAPVVEPEPVPTTTWPEGLAAELDCNLLESPGFEVATLPDNFWGDPNDPERERLVAATGVDGSTAVAIGRDGEFGLYGTIVDIRPNAEYVFAASVTFTAIPEVAEISVEWLDADFALIEGEAVAASIVSMAPGRAVLEVPAAPPGAAYAVTRLFKDSSGGVLSADELVFAERDSACDELLGLGG